MLAKVSQNFTPKYSLTLSPALKTAHTLKTLKRLINFKNLKILRNFPNRVSTVVTGVQC
jgi:hypothetical protein